MSPEAAPKRILWMDCEADFLRAHIRFLEKRRFLVETAASLTVAMELIRACPFDLVLLDEQTLGKEGASTLDRIRAACGRSIPLLLVTRNDEERARSSGLGRHVDGLVDKPVNPVQLEAACRNALLARADRTDPLTSAYVRAREEIKSGLLASPSPAKWEKIHFQMSRWDLEVHASPDAGLKETHRLHKQDLSRRFLAYVEDQYASWVGRQGGNPDLHTFTVRRKLLPILRRRAPAALVVLSGLRFDQWLVLQKQVEERFRVENAAAWALLPTLEDFCRTALFSGSLPREVSLDQPRLWSLLKEDEGGADACLRELLKIQIRKLGAEVEDPRFLRARTAGECAALAAEATKLADAPLVVLVAEFLDLLRPSAAGADSRPECDGSEADLRDAAAALLRTGGLGAFLAVLADQNRTVVLTSDHGSVRVDTPAEVFCQEEQSEHPRVKIGPNISCDERQALFVESPERFGLPGESGDTAYAIAKDRFYFVYPNKYQYFVTPHKDRMVSGGLSLEEVIVPLATLTPKAPAARRAEGEG